MFTPATLAGEFNELISARVVKGQRQLDVSVDVVILPDPLASLEVTPSELTIAPGGSQTFTAEGTDAFRNPIPSLEVSWSGDVGSITGDGRFTAPFEAGLATIVVSASYKGAEISKVVKVVIGTGPGVIIELWFNGQPAAGAVIDSLISLIQIEDQARRGFITDHGVLNSGKGYYVNDALPPGTYRFHVTFFLETFLVIRHGDLHNSILVTITEGSDINVVRLNLEKFFALETPYSSDDTVTEATILNIPKGPVLISWKALPEAVSYQVSINLNSDSDYRHVGNVVDQDVEGTRYVPDLAPNDVGQHYTLRVVAFNESREVIGTGLVKFFPNFWGSGMRFRLLG